MKIAGIPKDIKLKKDFVHPVVMTPNMSQAQKVRKKK
jgi:hypothetical protein